MRDIRSDLQERANFIEEQIRAAHAHFEQMVQQVQSERDVKVADLKGAHAMIDKLIEFEAGLTGDVLTLTNPQPPPQPSLANKIRKIKWSGSGAQRG